MSGVDGDLKDRSATLQKFRSRPELRVEQSDDNIVIRVGPCDDIATGPKETVRVPKHKSFKLFTPPASNTLTYLAETADSYLISLNELHLARLLGPDSLDMSKVLIKSQLGQAPLVPTILTNTEVCVPCCEYSVTSGRVTRRNLMGPAEGTREELLESLLNQYEVNLAGCETVRVFCSSGWDSRLEVACVAAVSRKLGINVELMHLCSGLHDKAIVDALGIHIGAKVHAEDISSVTSSAIKEPLGAGASLRNKLDDYSTWRPTIPVYHQLANQSLPERAHLTLGYTPYELRGRQYDLPVSSRVQDSGRLRVIQSQQLQATSSKLHSDSIEHQTHQWRIVTNLCEGWEPASRIDYALWVLNFGFSYSHRVNTRLSPWLWPITCLPDIASRFFGLPTGMKGESQFVDWAVRSLDEQLMNVPIASSSGGSPSKVRRKLPVIEISQSTFDIGLALLRGGYLPLESSFGRESPVTTPVHNVDEVALRQLLRFANKLSLGM